MGEGELQVAVPLLGAPVAGAAAGVVGPGNEPAVGDEVPGGGEALDIIDLEDQGQGTNTTDAGDPEEALEVGVFEEMITQEPLHLADLLTQKLDLVLEEAGLQAGEGRQLVR